MRIRLVQTFFTAIFIFLVISLYYLQLIKGSFYNDLSCRNSIRLLNIPSPRGNIYDRDNRLIAGSSLAFGIFIVPQEIDDLDVELKKLSGILGVPWDILERNYRRNSTAPFAPRELIRGISKTKAILVEEQKLNMPGIFVKEIPLRTYPYVEALSHVVGYVGEIDEVEIELLKPYGYNIKDMIGKDGIERFCDTSLRGKNGGMQLQIDNRGRQVKVLSFKRPRKGRDIQLTIDARLQRVVWNLMRGKIGAAIFMDPHRGEILSLVSSPSYDPHGPLVEVLRDPDSPLLNRAIMGLYPPGSLFKVIVSIAALETKSLRPGTSFLCKGVLHVGKEEFNCWDRDGHGIVNLERGIIRSCNVYFYNAGLLTGVDKLSEYASEFGLGRKTNIELFGERSGFIPSRQWKRAEKKEPWYPGDTANLAIGQGYLLVTPLQVCRMMAMVANGGIWIEPHILKKQVSLEGSCHGLSKPKIKKENLELVRGAMRKVVEDVDGTGNRAYSNIVSISAKTGTVQVGRGLTPHGWFAGFAPSDEPEISFVVFIEEGGSGGDVPAEIARLAVEYWYRNKK